MNQTKLVRNRVIINKPSLELLADLNLQADKVDAVVVIGVLPPGADLLGGKTVGATPFYMVLTEDMFKDPEQAFASNTFGFDRASVLQLLLDRAKQGK